MGEDGIVRAPGKVLDYNRKQNDALEVEVVWSLRWSLVCSGSRELDICARALRTHFLVV